MDIKQLRYFVAIVQCGSISRAALQLNVAQPALSLHIRNMEADLGVPLLFRTAQGVQATEAGVILMRNAQAILARFEEAQAEIRGSAAEPSGGVRVGLPSSISHLLGVPLILACRERYPNVKLRIADAMSGYVHEWLRQGRVDLGLLYNLVEDRGLRAVSLLSEALVLFGPAKRDGDEPAEGARVSLAAVAGRALILPSPGHGLRDYLDDKAADQGLRFTPSIEIDAFGAIKALVERGLGYTVLPAHAARQEIAEGRLRAWEFEPALVRVVYLVSPTDRPLSQATTAIAQLCRTTLAELVRSGAWVSGQMRVTT